MTHDPNIARSPIARDKIIATYHDWHTSELIAALEGEHDCVIAECFTEGAAHWHNVRWSIVFEFGPSDKDVKALRWVAFRAIVNLFPGVYQPKIWVDMPGDHRHQPARVTCRWFASGASAVRRTPRSN